MSASESAQTPIGRNPGKMSKKKVFYILVIALVSGMLILSIVLNLMTGMGFFPDTDVIVNNESINSRHRQILEKNGVIEKDEEIGMFFSAGIISVLEDGNLFTDDRVVIYQQDDQKKLQTFSLPFENITSIDMNKDDTGHPGFSMIMIQSDSSSGKTFGLPVSQENEADEKFFQGMVKAWRNKVPEDPNALKPVTLMSTTEDDSDTEPDGDHSSPE